MLIHQERFCSQTALGEWASQPYQKYTVLGLRVSPACEQVLQLLESCPDPGVLRSVSGVRGVRHVVGYMVFNEDWAPGSGQGARPTACCVQARKKLYPIRLYCCRYSSRKGFRFRTYLETPGECSCRYINLFMPSH